MDYNMAIDYIENKNKLGSVPGLSSITELLNRLDNPQNKCRCLHIAGTNGKGSVFSFVQEILICEGYKVGRYISPTIFSYLERFQINKEYMQEETFAILLSRVAEVVDEMLADGFSSPTSFEIETAIAFLFFVEQKVDYALIECGMGGALDATNVIEHPLVTVMAQISMDHMQFLGDKLTDIASQKVGIIKHGSICVSAPQSKEVMEIIDDQCKLTESRLIVCDEDELDIVSMDISGTIFRYKGEEYFISLLGEHQVTNAITAIEVVGMLDGVSRHNVDIGLRCTSWPGRLTRVSESPYVFVDGAHNEAAWLALKNAVNKYFTNRKIIYIIGVLRDKEYNKMVEYLGPSMSFAIAITPDNPRALDKETLAKALEEAGVVVTTANSHKEALEIAKDRAAYDDVILVCGSLSFISYYL